MAAPSPEVQQAGQSALEIAEKARDAPPPLTLARTDERSSGTAHAGSGHHRRRPSVDVRAGVKEEVHEGGRRTDQQRREGRNENGPACPSRTGGSSGCGTRAPTSPPRSARPTSDKHERPTAETVRQGLELCAARAARSDSGSRLTSANRDRPPRRPLRQPPFREPRSRSPLTLLAQFGARPDVTARRLWSIVIICQSFSYFSCLSCRDIAGSAARGRRLLPCCVLMPVASASSSSGLVIALIAVGVAGVVATDRRRTSSAAESGRRSLEQRLSALGSRLGIEGRTTERSGRGIERALSHIETGIDNATEAMEESSSDAIRLRRALDTLPQGVIVCDENGEDVFRNARADAMMGGRHGDALAAQAVKELLADAWREGAASRVLDLYGPPRRTLNVRTQIIDDGSARSG